MLVETVQDLLSLYQEGALEMPESPSEADLRPWRERIDALDRAVLQMLNERSVCANAIGHIKKQLGLPVYVPTREEQVLQNVTSSNGGPLPEAAVRRIFERIIDETRALERQKYQDDPEQSLDA